MSAIVPPITPPSPPATAGARPVPAGSPALAKPHAAAVFRMMFWKETRELAPWAALAALAFSIALAYKLDQATAGFGSRNFYSWDGFSIISREFLFLTQFVVPIIALLLGFVQFFAETKPDRFAFLVHRPSPRSLIFWAKILPGVAVYFTITLIPLAVAFLWASNPHHIPYPFSWAMTLPALSDVGAGLPYYFAGVLVARRTNARWIGSRLLPIAAPIVASCFNLGLSHLHSALLADLLATAVLLLAARGAFLTGGQYQSQSRPAKSALGAILALAIFVIAAFAIVALVQWLTPPQSSYRSVAIVFLADGTPARQIDQTDRPTRYEDLTGKLVIEIPPQNWDRHQHLVLVPSRLGNVFLQATNDRMPFGWADHFFTATLGTGPHVEWFRPAESNYLVGYDLHLRELVGSIGPDGFYPKKAVPPTRFKGSLIASALRGNPLIASGDTLYRLGDGYQLEPLFTTPDHAKIIDMSQLPSADDHIDRSAIATAQQLYVLSDATPSQILVSYPLPQTGRCAISVAYLEKADEYLFDITQYYLTPNFSRGPRQAVYIKSTGIVDRVVPLPEEKNTYEQRTTMIEKYIPMVSPPAGIVTLGVLESIWPDPPGMRKTLQIMIGYLEYSTVGAAATLLTLLALGRRYQFSRRAWILWLLLGLLLGPIGLLLLLCMRPLPHRLPCWNCRRKRPVSDAFCPHCHAEFTPPTPTGTEIFA